MEENTTKTVVHYGEEGRNRATVTDEEIPRDLRTEHAKTLVKEAGKLYQPIGFDYLGSAVIHYYGREVLASNPEFIVACQTVDINNVTEHHADIGHKKLGHALMKCFGRNPPKTRQ